MKAPLLALPILAACASAEAQAPQIIMPPASQQLVVPPSVVPIGPAVRLPPGMTLPNCLINPPPAAAIIGEKTTGIVGEKGSGAAIVGEKGYASDNPANRVFGDRWNAAGFTKFNHTIIGRPGMVKLNLYGCSSSPGGETVAVYLADSSGNRKTGWRHFVIATRNGNTREGTITLPPAPKGQSISRLPIVVVVENSSGKIQVGEYLLTVTP